MSTSSREVHLVARPAGMPSPADFSIVDVEMPGPEPGEVVDGLENAVAALLGMLSGANVGKMPVRLDAAAT
ncbi:hypothetical protein [Lentzea sp. E54]|uniref:hypothetical protein n=1 Tax=Lentzea xerophila TaxID=3435883 RepID=UPI003DA28757